MTQPVAADEPLLMIVAKAVAVLPTCTERLAGNTADTNGLEAAGTLMRPILPIVVNSVNQTAPSGPAVIPSGPLPGFGRGNSVMAPVAVIRPIRFPGNSVNHKAPSEPTAIPIGPLKALG